MCGAIGFKWETGLSETAKQADPRPTPGPGIPARRAALEAVGEVLDGQGKLQEVLQQRAGVRRLSDRDRSLARELAAGCVRHLAVLDAVAQAFCRKEWRRLHPAVKHLLRLGIYQLLFCDGIPARAAVNETVSLAHVLGQRRASGLVNAVLRAVEREVEFVRRAPGERRNVLPCRPGRWAVFKRPVLPDPGRSRAALMAVQYSYPEWLVRRWLARYGPEKTRALCLAGNEEAPVFLRPHPPLDVAGLIERLRDEGVEATASPSGRTAKLPPGVDTRRLRVLSDGLCLVQDDSAAAVAPFLAPEPGERVLDLCAAPGGKTCHLAALVGPDGEVVAVDHNARRLKRLLENVQRLGLANVATVEADGRSLPDLGGPFDRVLVDVPCSNTAVLRRRIEARWRVTERTLIELSRLQYELALAGAQCLKPGGALVYATCTMEPEENQHVLTRLIGAGPDLAMEGERQILPGAGGGDGVYMARLVRRA